MQAMLLTGLRQMVLGEVPTPAIRNETDVLLRVAMVGVCGSDVHYYETGRIGNQVITYPFVVGHECAGVVEAVGSQVRRVKPGDRVAVEPAVSCGDCDQCRSGRPHTCRRLKFLGCPGQMPGALSEFLVMPEACCLPIPPSMSFERAVLSEPLAIGLYAVRQSVSMRGARIGVLGAGPIGLCVVLAARAEGAEKIYVTDVRLSRLSAAQRAGAHWTGSADEVGVVEKILEQEPLGLDAVFECCGQQAAVDQAVRLLKPGGKLMMVGIPREERISLLIHEARRTEILFQNVRRQNHCTSEALDWLARGHVNADFMVTHHFTFEQTPTAFELVRDYADGVVKAMVQVGRS